MLRQIARLGHAVPSISPRAWAVAIYASADDDTMVAREAGFEGVACVDDTARALELYCELWNETKLPWARAWCDGLLDFVLAMQDSDGRWVNFIRDWSGTPNLVGRTSVAGGDFWQARAMLSLAKASHVLDDPRIVAALAKGLVHLVNKPVAADVRSLHVLAALAMAKGGEHGDLRPLVSSWCDELIECSLDGVLMNSSWENGQPHLWAHYQESALCDASDYLGRPELLDVARRSADKVFIELIHSRFERDLTNPFDVAVSCEAMRRLARTTDDKKYGMLVGEAREWFNGRNPADQPVYDRVKGRVADGIDLGVLNDHSGAESNIVAAQALFDDVIVLAPTLSSDEAGGPNWT